MPCSSTEHRARSVRVLLLAVLLGVGLGASLPPLAGTEALLTDSATLTASISVEPCDPADWNNSAAALHPVLEWHFEAVDLRSGDTGGPGLLECDPISGAWDLDATSTARSAPAPLVTPGDLTVTVWLDGTDGAAADGVLLSLRSATRDITVVVTPTGAEARYVATTGPHVLGTPPRPRSSGPYLLAVVVSPAGVRLSVDGVDRATGPPEQAPAGPLTLTVGETGTSADVLVDELLLVDQALPAAALAQLHAANTW